MITFSPGFSVKIYDEAIPGLTSATVWLERRCGDTNGEHKHVALGRIVGHGVCAYCRLGIDTLQREEAELLPCRQILFADERLVDVLVVVDRECRNFDLCIRAWQEVHVCALWQLHLELLDECGDVFV